jgi:hypothetical protein
MTWLPERESEPLMIFPAQMRSPYPEFPCIYSNFPGTAFSLERFWYFWLLEMGTDRVDASKRFRQRTKPGAAANVLY